jgi:nitroimidazol reductase NimA-like FMN-containing flavoprotein (pyridoxamine 5'-phosphate oxidase superfamily)
LPEEPVLDWSFVAERMAAATYYWITTASAAGQPHAAPLWGLWFEDRLYFDGSPATRWSRNLQANPAVAVHPPDAERVVMIEGTARMLGDDELTPAEWAQLDGLYRARYAVDFGSPYWVVEPRLVLAWDGTKLGTMTRWRFE